MKKIYTLLLVLTAVLSSSCSDFLDRKPLTVPNNETFLSSLPQVEKYINGLYMTVPSLTKFGMGARGEEKNSDNILAELYDRRLNGENTDFAGSADWTNGYQRLRSVNYFFHYYNVSASMETKEMLSLKGEAYFLRAYWHFFLLTRFGDIPVMDAFWDQNATAEGLQIPAKKRNDVAKFILNDLNTAKDLLYSRDKYSGLRINAEASMMLAMRVALYEGTWEKYHKGTDFYKGTDESGYFFEQVMTWGDLLFQKGITLNTKETDPTVDKAVNAGDAFAHLFNQKDLSQISEAVFWKRYNEKSGVFHALNGLLGSGVVDTGGPAGVSKGLVDNYLNLDGTVIDPNDSKFKNFNHTFENRDPRLTEVVMSSGAKFRSVQNRGPKPLLVKEYSDRDEYKTAINPPYLRGDGQGRNVTGFHIRLGVDTTFVSGNGETAFVLFRYSEALLNYAEAAEELGKCTDNVLDKTLKLLRERAGVTYVKPATIDPNFTDFGYSLTPTMQEIRRERRSELALQGFRMDDLMRWKAAKLIRSQRGRGAYLGPEEVLYKSFKTADWGAIDKVLVDENGWMDPLREYLPAGYQFDSSRDYLLPIPPDELQLNKQLHQNPGWEK